jgi:hypothetical protein
MNILSLIPSRRLRHLAALFGLLALGNSYAPVIDGVTAATQIKVVPPTLALVSNNAEIGNGATLTVAEGQSVAITAVADDIYGYPVEVLFLSDLPAGAQSPRSLYGVNPRITFTWTPPPGTAATRPVNLFTFAGYNDFNGQRLIKSVTVKVVSSPGLARANCLFDWAEKAFPALLTPAGFPTTVWTIYTYRWYSATNSYVGVSSVDNHVYYMGADGSLWDQGEFAYWLAQAGCQ